jgi:hypothetical protein
LEELGFAFESPVLINSFRQDLVRIQDLTWKLPELCLARLIDIYSVLISLRVCLICVLSKRVVGEKWHQN